MGVLSDCTVWCWRGAATPAAAAAVLSAGERERASKPAREGDRVRSAAGAGLLRLAVAHSMLDEGAPAGTPGTAGAGGTDLNALASRLDIDRACPTCAKQHGRPVVRAPWPERCPEVSVTHTGTDDEAVVLIAVSRAGRVGIDAETVTGQDFTSMASLVLSPAELAAGPPGDQSGWFRVWVRKEAVLKATGDGLRTPMPELVLGAGPSLVSYAGRPMDCDLRDLELGGDVAAAIAVLGAQRPGVIQVRDAVDLLH